MNIEFSPAKDVTNREKHGVSLAKAQEMEWETALIWPDLRFDYGEPRMSCLGYIDERLHYLAFVDRQAVRRIISLRKANKREERLYAST